MQKYLTEFIGTFFLVLTIGLALAPMNESGGVPPLAIGAALIAMIYMGAPISGAHFNPAVSLALLLRGKMQVADFVPYLLAQIGAALVAAWISYFVTGVTFAPQLGSGIGADRALLVEALYTFALVAVILNTATVPRVAGNGYYGFAIGFVVVAGAFTVGTVSGAAFNPAVAIGPTLIHAWRSGGSLGQLWIYLVGPCAGAVLASLVFRLQHSADELSERP